MHAYSGQSPRAFNVMRYVCSVCNVPANKEVSEMHRMGLLEVPDRSVGYEETWWSDYMCPKCFDAYISLFPITMKRMVQREVRGKWP